MTVETGLLTSICAVLDLILYLAVVRPLSTLNYASRSSLTPTLTMTPASARQPTGLHLLFNLALSKLYALSLLAALAARHAWRAPSAAAAAARNSLPHGLQARPDPRASWAPPLPSSSRGSDSSGFASGGTGMGSVAVGSDAVVDVEAQRVESEQKRERCSWLGGRLARVPM